MTFLLPKTQGYRLGGIRTIYRQRINFQCPYLKQRPRIDIYCQRSPLPDTWPRSSIDILVELQYHQKVLKCFKEKPTSWYEKERSWNKRRKSTRYSEIIQYSIAFHWSHGEILDNSFSLNRNKQSLGGNTRR